MTIYLCRSSELMDLPGTHLLSQRRRERINSYLQQEDKARCLGAGLLLRHLPGAGEKHILLTAHGKPYLQGGNIFFNLSHGGRYVVLGADADEVGVDIEPLASIPNGVASQVYTAEEQAWMVTHPDRISFYRLWTGKESVMKAHGLGFSMSPQDFSILPLRDGLHRINCIDWHLNWYYIEDHLLCVCSKKEGRKDLIFLTREQLLE